MSGFKSATNFKIIILSFQQEPLIFNEKHGRFQVQEKNTLRTGRVSDLIVETGFDENSVPKYTFLSHKNTQIRATNNGFVFETCLPNRFEPIRHYSTKYLSPRFFGGRGGGWGILTRPATPVNYRDA